MSQTTDPAGRSAAELESEVERSRERLGATIETLRGSLSPGQLVDQAMDYARGSGGADFVRNLGGQLRDNPLPVMLIGAGIGWLLLADRKEAAAPVRLAPAHPPLLPPPAPSRPLHGTAPEGPGLVGRLGEGAAGLRDQASGAAAGLRDQAADAADGLRQAGRSAMESVSDGLDAGREALQAGVGRLREQAGAAQQTAGQGLAQGQAALGAAGDRLRQDWAALGDARPLLLGVLGLAAGAALGALLPRSEAEDKLMGEASDAAARSLREAVAEGAAQAGEVLGEEAERLQEAAAETYGAARDKLQRDGLSAQTLGETVQTVAERAAAAGGAAGSRLAEAADHGIDRVAEAGKAAVADGEAPRDAAKTGSPDDPARPGARPAGLP
ncbi:DUF3618 domain-containing protein [Roseomonas sp. USHLN139]|uniref:DUF3618 domain-containing protein n=1 Tax=Roseomonas sp. USHLN139 TaxID=3081298 RepID=UPI003B028EB3